MSRHTVTRNGVSISVDALGEGPPVLMLASLGRGASDFELLARTLAASGFRALAVDPRGVGESSGSLENLTLHDLAADAAAVIEQLGPGPAHVVGHAFGQRVARCVAVDFPHLVRTVTILAAGGAVHPEPEVQRSLLNCFDLSLPDDQRIKHIRVAFFADGNDPRVWEGGWWPEAARAQGAAVRATPTEDWWLGGSAPTLVIQGLEDRTAPPANGRLLRDEAPDRVRLVELEHAGHALLPEQPDRISELVIGFLRAND